MSFILFWRTTTSASHTCISFSTLANKFNIVQDSGNNYEFREGFRNPRITPRDMAESNLGPKYFLEYSTAKMTFYDSALRTVIWVISESLQQAARAQNGRLQNQWRILEPMYSLISTPSLISGLILAIFIFFLAVTWHKLAQTKTWKLLEWNIVMCSVSSTRIQP